jgi:hypothetical protein
MICIIFHFTCEEESRRLILDFLNPSVHPDMRTFYHAAEDSREV